MNGNSQDKKDKYVMNTAAKLSSPNEEIVMAKLQELRATGNFKVLPLLLDLAYSHKSQDIVKEVLNLLSELKESKCVPVLVDHLSQDSKTPLLHGIIASCWQSGLDYSIHLLTFAKLFIDGDYSVAFESFTVIEENLWRAEKSTIDNCISYLVKNEAKVKEELKPLYVELIKLLHSGTTENAEEYPEFYKS